MKKICCILSIVGLSSSLAWGATPVLEADGASAYGIFCGAGMKTGFAVKTEFSFEAWIKPALATAEMSGQINRIAGTGNCNSTGYFGVYLDNEDKLVFGISGVKVQSASALPIGEWTHIAVVRTTTGDMSIYLNGALDVVQEGACTADLGQYPFTLCSFSNSSSQGIFCGHMAEVRLWGVALSASDIQARMSSRLTLTEEKIVGYWPLDDLSMRTAEQMGRGYRPQISMHYQAAMDDDLELPACTLRAQRVLTATADNMTLATSYSWPKDRTTVSFEAWIKPTVFPGTAVKKERFIVGFLGDAGTGRSLLSIYRAEAGENGKVVLRYFCNGASLTNSEKLGTTAINLNEWIHVAMTRTESELKVYLNGQLEISATATFPKLKDGQVHIGYWSERSNAFGGNMMDLRIWDDVRTQEEIVANMNVRLTGQEPNLVSYIPINFNTFAYNVDLVSRGLAFSTSQVSGYGFAYDGTAPLLEPLVEDSLEDVVFAGYRMNDNVAPNSDDMNQPLRYTGIDAGVQVPAGDFTCEAWVIRDAYKDNNMIFSAGTLKNGSTYGFHFCLNSSSKLRLFARWKDLDSKTELVGTKVLGWGEWAHVALTRKGGTLSIYMNGKPEGSYTDVGLDGWKWDGDGNLMVGYFLQNFNYEGALREIRVWNVARTAEELTATMHQKLSGREPGLIAYFPLDKNTGSALKSGIKGVADGIMPYRWIKAHAPELAPVAVKGTMLMLM